MADMTPLADILNGDPASATDVQNNFQIIEAYINSTNLIRADGTEVMAANLDVDSHKIVNLAAATLVSDAPRFDQTGVADYEVTSGAVTLPDATLTTVDTVSVTTPAVGMCLVGVHWTPEAAGVTFGGGFVDIYITVSGTGGTGVYAGGNDSVSLSSNAVGAAKAALFLVPLASGANTITVSATGTRGGGATGGTVTITTGARTAVIGAF